MSTRASSFRPIVFLVTATVIGALSAGDARAVTYDGFDDTTGLTINGNASTAMTADGDVLRLTPAASNQGGSVFSTAVVSTEVFTSVFSFRITNPGGQTFDNNDENGADGLTFLVQNQANNVGGIGAGIGYAGISPSLVVEFDTWGNNSNNDPSQSHIGINLNGNTNHNAAGQGPTINIGDVPSGAFEFPGNELDDGDRWWAWVVNDMSNVSVYLLASEASTEPAIPATPILTFPVDLESVLGGQTAFAGFTSGTGAAWANHDLLYWRYDEALPIPEPAAALLMALGLGLGLGACGRRR